ncbi:osteopetrosis-associated transmembrane protein 1 [Parasteatoda tepidariorum]|uniref:osteopetrosis-associated transmembrane protein 1 n=1 Tax=Parasteatoda tepidariorum TaxID=114398 RepID=UPI00077FDD77|nr:osteopetrosis-associated transmembrane protein 1 [Parasteatoda tepidariorum]
MQMMCSRYFAIFLMIISFCNVISAIDHSLIDSLSSKPTPLIKSHEKVLNMSLKSFYNEEEHEHIFPAPSPNCSWAFGNFSEAVVNFTRCALEHARPVRVCYQCGNAYNVSVAKYNNLRKQGEECEEIFFSSDQIAIVDVLYSNVNQLWSNNYCQNCYLDPNLTKGFFNISKAFMDCVHKNRTGFLPANTTCTDCHSLYADLSNKYGLFVLSPGDYGKICMDVVDTMNLTRRIWKLYNCLPPFDYNLGYPNIIVALAIGVTPVLFYLLAKNISIIEDVKIVRPKRKFTPAVSTIQPLKE